MFPSTFQIEPVDLLSFDVWQDWEGLQDASNTCRGAWAEFRVKWREARAGDFEKCETADDAWKTRLDKTALDTWRKARRLGAAMGMLPAKHPVELSQQDRDVWWAWRSRVLRADPAAWYAFWNVASGTSLMETAAQWRVTERYVLAVVHVLCRWLDGELWQADNSVGEAA